jgi:hypothetical protein
MRYYLFILPLFFIAFTVQSQQLTLVPQVGVQFEKSKLEYGTLASINNRYRHLAPYAGVRLLYQGKKGHGLFAGVASGASGYSYELFIPLTTDMNYYDRHRSSTMKSLWRFELGYHWNSKPIYFKKIWDNHINREDFAGLKRKGWSVRLQPLIGLGYQFIPDEGSGWTESQSMSYIIREEDVPMTRRSNFAVVAGLGFEFGKNDRRKFVLSFNYIKGMGQSTTRTKLSINTALGNYNGLLGSNGSGFNITFGIPITLWKKKRSNK